MPLIDGILGASVPKLTWFGAIVSLAGIGLLECGGSPPCVSCKIIFVLVYCSLVSAIIWDLTSMVKDIYKTSNFPNCS